MKRQIARIVSLVLALSMLLPMNAMATTTYSLTVTLLGPNAQGDSEVVTRTSSRYGLSTDSVLATVAQSLFTIDVEEEIESKFAGTGLRSQFELLKAAAEDAVSNNGTGNWEIWVESCVSNANQRAVLKNLESTFSDLQRIGSNIIASYYGNSAEYHVYIQLNRYSNGSNANNDKFIIKTTSSGGTATTTVTNRDTHAVTTTVTKTDPKTGTTTVNVTDKDRYGHVEKEDSVTIKDGNKEITTTTITDKRGRVDVTVTERETVDGVILEKVYKDGELTEINSTTTDGNKSTTVKEDSNGNKISTTEITKVGDRTTEVVTTPAGDKTVTVSVWNTKEETIVQTQNWANGVTVDAAVSSDRDASASIKIPESALESAKGNGYGDKILIAFPGGDGNLVLETLEDGTRHPLEYALVRHGMAYLLTKYSREIEIVYRVGLFEDMTGSWAEEYTDFTGGREIFKGTSTDSMIFEPNLDITRGMIATVLHRLEQEPEASQANMFEDVERDIWYDDAVSWGFESGIIKGYNNERFGPKDPITREQMAVMMYRYADKCGYTLSGGFKDIVFTDADEISDYAKEAMAWAVSRGLFEGYADGSVHPKEHTTRAVAAVILHRFIENVVDAEKK